MLLPLLAAAALLATFTVLAAPNATITVTNNLDSGSGSLRQAIADANSGDTINFAASLSGQSIPLILELSIDKSLTISGSVPITVSGINATRVFNVKAGNVTFDSLTIRNGNVQTYDCGATSVQCGGGIIIQNSGVAVSIINSTLISNTADRGGGIYNNYGTLTITNSTLISNTATFNGGGIYNETGTTTVTGSRILNNTATTNGGGVYNYLDIAGATSVTGSCIVGNSAMSYFNIAPAQQIATGNWWGATTGPNTSGADTVLGNVDVCCHLTEPILGCGLYVYLPLVLK